MTKEERAKIARENGAKSQGPKTEEGKAKSSRNGIKTGDFAEKLAAFVPPDSAVLCNEQRQAYFNLVDQLTQIYLPINQESMNLVRQIAIARWQIERLHTATNNVWNFALLKAGGESSDVVEEMADAEAAARAAIRMFSGNSPIEKMSRQIDRLELRISRLRKGIKEIHADFPNVAKPIENKPVPEEKTEETPKSEPTVYVTERDPQVLAAYRRDFPTTKLSSCLPTMSPKASTSKTICRPHPARRHRERKRRKQFRQPGGRSYARESKPKLPAMPILEQSIVSDPEKFFDNRISIRQERHHHLARSVFKIRASGRRGAAQGPNRNHARQTAQTAQPFCENNDSRYPSGMRLGIDFGTTRIVVAASDRGNYPVVSFEAPDLEGLGGEVCDWYPLLAGIANGRRIYGWTAWAAQTDSQATVIRSLKRFLSEAGPQTPVDIAGHLAPLSVILQELAADLLNAIRKHSNLVIPPGDKLEVMLGVPASANSNQRFLTVEAFRQAGFDVIGLLNEPSAASVEYGHSHRDKTTRKNAILVYDLGGGTFDASLVELDARSHAVIASEGLATLGGDDFDRILSEVALEAAGLDGAALSQSEWFRLDEESRRKKESLHPNSRRIAIDLDLVRSGWPQVHIAVSDFYDRCEPLIKESLHAVDDLCARADSLEAIYVTGGGSELPLVSRLLRERYKSRMHRSPYTRAATAIGLAIQADESAGYVLRDQFTRYFGVWREADGGARMRFDPLFAKGSPLPNEGDAPLQQSREYLSVHNIGHFRYLECSHLNASGRPEGDITVWDEIHFPFDPALAHAANLDQIPVQRTWQNQRIGERFSCGPGGELAVTIANLDAHYERTYRLGRWGANAPPIVPGKSTKAPVRRKKASNNN